MKVRRWVFAAAAIVAAMSHALAAPPGFTYAPPGELVPGSGTGSKELTEYAPGIRFPIEISPAYANSQVWGVGGLRGPAGSQCDQRNFSYPWHDNFCETRDRRSDRILCESQEVHQGQDIRAATCAKDRYWAVAAAAGTITKIGMFSVYLTTDDGSTRFEYLHMSQLAVRVGQTIMQSQRLGMISDVFSAPTTVHLHFNMHVNLAGVGFVYVPPYISLVKAYERLP